MEVFEETTVADKPQDWIRKLCRAHCKVSLHWDGSAPMAKTTAVHFYLVNVKGNLDKVYQGLS